MGTLGIGVAHTPLTRSLLDAQASLLSTFAGYITSDSASAVADWHERLGVKVEFGDQALREMDLPGVG